MFLCSLPRGNVLERPDRRFAPSLTPITKIGAGDLYVALYLWCPSPPPLRQHNAACPTTRAMPYDLHLNPKENHGKPLNHLSLVPEAEILLLLLLMLASPSISYFFFPQFMCPGCILSAHFTRHPPPPFARLTLRPVANALCLCPQLRSRGITGIGGMQTHSSAIQKFQISVCSPGRGGGSGPVPLRNTRQLLGNGSGGHNTDNFEMHMSYTYAWAYVCI